MKNLNLNKNLNKNFKFFNKSKDVKYLPFFKFGPLTAGTNLVDSLKKHINSNVSNPYLVDQEIANCTHINYVDVSKLLGERVDIDNTVSNNFARYNLDHLLAPKAIPAAIVCLDEVSNNFSNLDELVSTTFPRLAELVSNKCHLLAEKPERVEIVDEPSILINIGRGVINLIATVIGHLDFIKLPVIRN